MILHSHLNNVSVKHCKKSDFYLGKGAFHNVFYDKSAEWPIVKK
jgi:hypothetical protein